MSASDYLGPIIQGAEDIFGGAGKSLASGIGSIGGDMPAWMKVLVGAQALNAANLQKQSNAYASDALGTVQSDWKRRAPLRESGQAGMLNPAAGIAPRLAAIPNRNPYAVQGAGLGIGPVSGQPFPADGGGGVPIDQVPPGIGDPRPVIPTVPPDSDPGIPINRVPPGAGDPRRTIPTIGPVGPMSGAPPAPRGDRPGMPVAVGGAGMVTEPAGARMKTPMLAAAGV